MNRCLFDFENGSKFGVGGLATTGSGRVAAIDFSGRLTVWSRHPETGQWGAQLIRQSDFDRFDQATTQTLDRFRRFGSAIAASKNEFVFFAEPKPVQPDIVAPHWDLVRRSLETGKETILAAPTPHAGGVPAIGVSGNGNRIVSADLGDAGRFFVWDLARNPMATSSQMNAPVRTVSVSATGQFLLIGTANNASGQSQVVLWRWDANGFQNLETWHHSSPVLSSCISPDEKWLAYSVESQVVIKSLEDPKLELPSLASNHIAMNRVAFAANESNGYQVLLEEQNQLTSRKVFDPHRSSLDDEDTNAKIEWIDANPNPGRWALKQTIDARSGTYNWHVEIDGQRQCSIPLDSNADGLITSVCWIGDPGQPDLPVAIAAGTSKRNHLYVFKLTTDGQATLVRQYRGHESSVGSVGVSFDRRYLVSSSDDSTVRFWKLDDAIVKEGGDLTLDYWGASFAVEENRLVIREILADGPLYFRGMRSGDSIDAISWRPTGQLDETKIDDPGEMLQSLRSSDYQRMVRFDCSRNAVARPHFYLYPAWQPVASLVVTGDREWAFWSPYGYYDASFNGHKHFGWQINRGIDQPPDFFRAAEMRNELERPALMKNLLNAGSMEDAFLALRRSAPSNMQDRLAAENRLRPHIQILRPDGDGTVSGNETMVEAIISLPNGIRPVLPKVFANGVPADRPRLVGTETKGELILRSYQWRVPLPGDRRIRIQVFAASQHGSADVAHVDVEHREFEPAKNRRLYLIAAGVNHYGDSQIPTLQFAVNNVSAFRQVLGADGNPVYELDSTVLLEKSANRPLWGVAAENVVEQLRATARPDDLLVIFLSGHGVSDPASDQYYFVTSSSRYTDLVGRQYGDCIALEDFAKFADIPCRKLVILDTCESGAFRATGQHDLKPLVRALESGLFFTITASEGSANAYESTKDQLSFLTASLVAGMRGDADLTSNGGNNDGGVGFDEIARFVANRVPAEIAGIGGKQYPGAAPKELLGFAEIPLTIRNGEPGR